MRLGTREEASVDKEQQRYDRAQSRAKELRDFYTHATVYVLVNIGLFVINVLTGGGWWFYWPLLGWGIGLGIHALSVFAFGGGLSAATGRSARPGSLWIGTEVDSLPERMGEAATLLTS
jgi:hypothetical protein